MDAAIRGKMSHDCLLGRLRLSGRHMVKRIADSAGRRVREGDENMKHQICLLRLSGEFCKRDPITAGRERFSRLPGEVGRSLCRVGRSPREVGLWLFATISVFLILLLPTGSHSATLQEVYDAAGPNGQYTKYLVLDAGVTYTGGLIVPSTDRACIKGNGAILDLQTSTIQMQGMGAKLDIDHCVIKNGCLPSSEYSEGALSYIGCSGRVLNNTFYGNTIGIRIYLTGQDSVVVMNNIFAHNSVAGVLFLLGSEPNVSYNDSWANGLYNYAADWGCDGKKPWSPIPGTGEISADPLFVNETLGDLHLLPGSPCVSAGVPAGTYMGALSSPIAVSPTSWGRIKAMFVR